MMPIQSRASMKLPMMLLLAAGLILSGCRENAEAGGGGGQTVNQEHSSDTAAGGKPVTFTIGYASGDPATKQAIEAAITAYM